jgi:hypothetical protein
MFGIDKDFIKELAGIFGMVFVLFGLVGGIILGVIVFYGWATDTPENRAKTQEAAIPRVYAQVDGCTVYVWNSDSRNHYFTRCDNTNKVVTENSWKESCGKACSKTITEKVETN